MPNPTNEDSASPKDGAQKAKKFHNKTRDGCNSCRRRRVKCSMERPRCKACCRLDLGCDYRIDRGHIDVRRLEDGQTFIIPVTSKALLPPHFESSKISFWILNTLPLLSSVGQPPKLNKSVPSLFTNKDGGTVFMNAYHTFDRMWRLLTLPLAYTEKGIFDMLCVLGKQHQLALQPEGSQEAFKTQDYAQVLCIVSNVVKRCPPETVLAAISILFAYERLASAVTATDPPDRFIVHSNAMKSLIAQPGINPNALSYFSGPAIFSASMRSFWLDRSRSLGIDVGTLDIPETFSDLFSARDVFFEILRAHADNSQTRAYMARWSMAMRKYYEDCKRKDWNDARTALTMLTEFEYLRTVFEASTMGA